VVLGFGKDQPHGAATPLRISAKVPRRVATRLVRFAKPSLHLFLEPFPTMEGHNFWETLPDPEQISEFRPSTDAVEESGKGFASPLLS
jgi:hypothetical protein